MSTPQEADLYRNLSIDEHMLLFKYNLLTDEQKELIKAKLDEMSQKNL
jgi:hypothetical protein